MTMETYRWQRTHLATPPLTVSIMRNLPEGDWMVRAEDWTLPSHVPTKYDTLERAMQAADDAARTERSHDCGAAGCGKWMPVPPTT
jgi:hypothetical protein